MKQTENPSSNRSSLAPSNRTFGLSSLFICNSRKQSFFVDSSPLNNLSAGITPRS